MARYGHQDIWSIFRLSPADMRAMKKALGSIVQREQEG